ncbi:hypothetical protein COV19_02240 [Candidatus Woesearchaeota archaeon CG10_big_fil_rev_8_21_14_0_10_44_13]|nr:MAG: hypothetical protein COV19_02240 [Candidatus Woesearchaeota archaeon CG10_big_fil_rev_8_21_14_0_10_44_13]
MIKLSAKIKYMIYFTMFVISLIALTSGLLKSGPIEKLNIPKDKFCGKDSDCACGISLDTGDCFYGNREYVDPSQQCPDFCTGIAAMFEIRCVNNTCVQVKVR